MAVKARLGSCVSLLTWLKPGLEAWSSVYPPRSGERARAGEKRTLLLVARGRGGKQTRSLSSPQTAVDQKRKKDAGERRSSPQTVLNTTRSRRPGKEIS